SSVLPVAREIAGDVAGSPAVIDAHIAADDPAHLAEPLQEGCVAGLVFRIIRYPRHEHAKAPYARRRLRTRSERPCRRATEQRDELATRHSITSSARARADADMSGPSALAGLTLIADLYFVGACHRRA